jgi:hypothetical protein
MPDLQQNGSSGFMSMKIDNELNDELEDEYDFANMKGVFAANMPSNIMKA